MTYWQKKLNFPYIMSENEEKPMIQLSLPAGRQTGYTAGNGIQISEIEGL
jgi:hypothetical protein